MKKETEAKESKQLDLRKWMRVKSREKRKAVKRKKHDGRKEDPQLAFGYGYNPEILKEGITDFSFSHALEDGTKLYEISPKISYKIFPVLAKILNYKCIGNELRKGNTVIKNRYFTSDQEPEDIVHELNSGIQTLFQKYEPIPKYDIRETGSRSRTT